MLIVGFVFFRKAFLHGRMKLDTEVKDVF